VRGLLEAWVARLAECRLEQKAGYSQHAMPLRQHSMPNYRNPTTILNILIKLKNNGKSKYTITFVDKSLTHLSKHADLDKPEEVKQYIASKEVSNSYKKNLCFAYEQYCKYHNIKWEMPLYRQDPKGFKIPTTAKVDMLIAKARRGLSIKLRVSKETGLRPIELCNLRVKDLDQDKALIYPTTAKNGASRILRISKKLLATLQDHIEKNKLSLEDKLFRGTAENYGKYYRQMRNNLAEKLNDQTLRTIRLYDFRHYFASMLYSRTRDILLVKQQMGHKKIETTLIYTQLLHLDENDNFTCKTARNVKEATELIENGFQYIQEIDGIRLYRKRK